MQSRHVVHLRDGDRHLDIVTEQIKTYGCSMMIAPESSSADLQSVAEEYIDEVIL